MMNNPAPPTTIPSTMPTPYGGLPLTVHNYANLSLQTAGVIIGALGQFAALLVAQGVREVVLAFDRIYTSITLTLWDGRTERFTLRQVHTAVIYDRSLTMLEQMNLRPEVKQRAMTNMTRMMEIDLDHIVQVLQEARQ